jgi:hypothetical protein
MGDRVSGLVGPADSDAAGGEDEAGVSEAKKEKI